MEQVKNTHAIQRNLNNKTYIMSYIISANYRNRDSEYRWLVRKADEAPEKAIAFKRVTAEGVRTQASSAYEDGFGCRIVAVAEGKCVLEEREPSETPEVQLRFNGFSGFYVVGEARHDIKKNMTSLRLEPDGSIFAVV